jgi:hypothetical protein
MIKGIYQSGRYMQVNNGSPSWPSIYNSSYGSSNNAQSFSGQVRYNSQAGGMEIFDGSMWQAVGNSITQVGLTAEAERILDWAQKKMLEEFDLKERMEKHPGLKDAYEKFRIMDVLTLEEKEKEGFDAGVQSGP